MFRHRRRPGAEPGASSHHRQPDVQQFELLRRLHHQRHDVCRLPDRRQGRLSGESQIRGSGSIYLSPPTYTYPICFDSWNFVHLQRPINVNICGHLHVGRTYWWEGGLVRGVEADGKPETDSRDRWEMGGGPKDTWEAGLGPPDRYRCEMRFLNVDRTKRRLFLPLRLLLLLI